MNAREQGLSYERSEAEWITMIVELDHDSSVKILD